MTAATSAQKLPALNLSGRIPELDGLRGLAILLVILCHYVGNSNHAPLGLFPHRLLSLFSVGWSGVDLFFVLSGFLIGGILLDACTAPHYFRAFYVRRVFRILPIYYVWILLYGAIVAAALWLLPGRTSFAPHDFLRLPLQFLFFQNMTYALTPFQWIWFSVTWSLAVEEQFYLVAPPLIRFLSPRRLLFVLAATISMAPLLRLLVLRYLREGNYAAVFAMPCRADALAWGILLALAWRWPAFRAFLDARRLLMRRALAALFLGLGLLLWWLVHPINVVTVTIGYTWLALFYSCLLLVALSQADGWIASVMRWRFLRRLGAISYCVYILHLAFNYLVHRVLLHAPPQIYNAAGVVVTLLALLLTLVVAAFSWRFFEKPLIRRGHSYSYGDNRAQFAPRTAYP
jgi:peptidoglycan/LPS O-acetylase OafA/YrhL